MPDAVQGPNIDIDIDAKHLVELVDMDEMPSQYRDKRKDAMMMIFKFNVWNLTTGEAIIDHNTELLWDLWGFTPDVTFKNETTGKVAKAREWTEALIGRAMTDDEMKQLIQSGFKEGLIGKKAVADLEWYTSKSGVEKVGIIRLRPHKAAQNGTTAAKKEPVAVAAGGAAESKEERRTRLQREIEEANQE